MFAGETIGGQFVVERLAASGGMGRVFQARDRRSGNPVALKVLLRQEGVDVERFAREARALAELSHPGIVRYVDHGVLPEGDPYLVMEWLEGEDLAECLQRGRLPLSESLTVAIRAAEALGVAHAQGIVHRDLKPKNLFLVEGRTDRIKLLDFGIARLRGALPVTQVGAMMGTPGYMAPEQARGETMLDAQADVYALGCVLFECLTGKPAFQGPHSTAILVKVLFEETPRVRDILPEVPAELDALLQRMLAKDPAARPRDGAAMVEELMALSPLITGGGTGERAALQTDERPEVLTRAEQRVLSVILIAPDPAPGRAAGGLPAATAPPSEALVREVNAFGGRLEHLIDGSTVITITSERVATDQAVIAARCALALAPHVRGRALALTTGYGTVRGWMPVSDVVDRATRMLLMPGAPPEPGGSEADVRITIDEVTAGLLDARFEVDESEAGLVLRGMHELSTGPRTLLGRPTACVGRDRELAMLAHIFDGCVEESRAQAVLLLGGAGLGKSRLAQEFVERLSRRSEPVSVWVGRGDSLGVSTSLGVLGQAIQSVLGIHEGEPIEVRREKLVAYLAGTLADHVAREEQRRVAEFLGELIGAPFPEDSPALRAARKDAQLMNKQMRAAWEYFLRAECALSPVVLVLEDLHWGDLPTVNFIDGALRGLNELPWMVLALARPEVRQLFPNLWADRTVQMIPLQPLGRKAGERLIRQVLGPEVAPDTVERLLQRADGNPFYLEELIRAVTRQRGEALPETVVAMVQSRLSGLDGETRRILRAASVFGEVFWSGAVAYLLGDDARLTRVRDRLGELVEQEVILRRPESRFPGEEEFTFRHAFLHEGAYAMLVEEDRVLGHRLAGEWLERRGENSPIVMAEHFMRGQDPKRAGHFYLHATERALATGDLEATVTQAQRGLTCGLPESARIELLGALCEVHAWRFSMDAAAPYIEEVLRLATRGSAPWARAMLTRFISAIYRRQMEEALTVLRAIEGVEPTPEALGYVLMIMCAGTYLLATAGRLDVSGPLLERMRAVVAPVVGQEPNAVGWLRYTESLYLGYAAEAPASGLQAAQAATACFREAQSEQGLLISRIAAGMNLWLLGLHAPALEEFRATGGPATDASAGDMGSLRRFAFACALADAGALTEAQAEAMKLIEYGRARGLATEEGRGHWALSEMLLRQGALAAVDEAHAAVEGLSLYPFEQVAAKATLSASFLAQGRLAEARGMVEEAVTQYRAIGGCSFCRGPFLLFTHAQCLRAAGEDEAYQVALAEARGHLLTIAARIGDEGLRASFLAAVPPNAQVIGTV